MFGAAVVDFEPSATSLALLATAVSLIATPPAAFGENHIDFLTGREIAGDSFVFKDRAQRTLTTTSTAVRDAVAKLARMYPLTATPEQLVAECAEADNEQDKRDIERSLFNMVMAGIADVSIVPVTASTTVEHRPRAVPLARADARDGQTWTTNPRHETVPLSLVARAVLPMLDGTNSQTELIRKVQALVAEGAITFHKDGEKLARERADRRRHRQPHQRCLIRFSPCSTSGGLTAASLKLSVCVEEGWGGNAICTRVRVPTLRHRISKADCA